MPKISLIEAPWDGRYDFAPDQRRWKTVNDVE